MDPDWLERAKRLQAIAQTGLAFTHDAFDRERYETIRAVAAEMIAAAVAGAGFEADAGLRARELDAVFAGQSGYATPKVDVRAAVFREERILLVRERSDGGWTLPGGWADVGDSPSRAVEREVLEESGYEVRAVKLAAVLDRNRHRHTPHLFHIWKLFFLCEITGGRGKGEIAGEVSGEGEITGGGRGKSGAGAAAGSAGRAADPAGWAPRTSDERLRSGATASSAETDAADFFQENALPPLSLGRVTAEQIAHMFEHHRHPELPTTFD